MASSDIPPRVSSYTVLPVALPPLPSLPNAVTHYFYARPHAPKHPDAATPRSLFLANCPFDAHEALIKHLLSTQLGLSTGRIEEVSFLDIGGLGRSSWTTGIGAHKSNLDASEKSDTSKSKSKKRKRAADEELAVSEIDSGFPDVWDRQLLYQGGHALIKFVDRTSMEAAMKAIKKVVPSGKRIVWGEGLRQNLPPLGAQRYITHQKLSFPPRQTLINAADEYMTAYTDREAAQTRVEAKKRAEPDADGFVTVSRNSGAARSEQAARRLERERARRRGFDDFYRFQFRENRKAKATELLKKFEQDREKVRKMREQKGRLKPE